MTWSRGFSKVRCSSVKASGGSRTPFASRATRERPVPSDAVSRTGAPVPAASSSAIAGEKRNEAGVKLATETAAGWVDAAGRGLPGLAVSPAGPAVRPRAARASEPRSEAVRNMGDLLPESGCGVPLLGPLPLLDRRCGKKVTGNPHLRPLSRERERGEG